MEEKIRLGMPVIVEGKYDKLRIAELVEDPVLTTDGFGIFKNHEREALIRSLAEPCGVAVLTDPDGAGKIIRGHLSGILPPEKIHHLYVPAIEGKEKRKNHPSREGVLGVEGVPPEKLREILSRFAESLPESPLAKPKETGDVTRNDFYEWGLCGKADSSDRRDALAASLSLPSGMSTKALVGAVNYLVSREELLHLLDTLFPEA
ncbi:MAG: DUF4093 domain-containing protein [Clostridia bacterium]|nr:DUF4093 domain-containing protein [Clostridia bacterium]